MEFVCILFHWVLLVVMHLFTFIVKSIYELLAIFSNNKTEYIYSQGILLQ